MIQQFFGVQKRNSIRKIFYHKIYMWTFIYCIIRHLLHFLESTTINLHILDDDSRNFAIQNRPYIFGNVENMNSIQNIFN